MSTEDTNKNGTQGSDNTEVVDNPSKLSDSKQPRSPEEQPGSPSEQLGSPAEQPGSSGEQPVSTGESPLAEKTIAPEESVTRADDSQPSEDKDTKLAAGDLDNTDTLNSVHKQPSVLDVTTSSPEDREVHPAQVPESHNGTTLAEPETTESTTERTVSTTQSTTQSTTTQSITTQSTASSSKPSTKLAVVIPDKSEPPYAIVTSSTPTNESMIEGPADKAGLEPKNIAIIVTSVGGILLLAIIIFLLFWFIRKRRNSRKEEIQTIENPRYNKPTIIRTSPAGSAAPHQYRFSTDADLSIGEVRKGKLSNNNLKPSPLYSAGQRSHSPTGSGSPGSTGRKKRKAPPPPNPFGNDDLYEKDSHNSADEYELQTFGNISSFGKPTIASPPGDNVTQPLLNGKAGNKRSADYSSSSSSSSSSDEEEETAQKAREEKCDELAKKDMNKYSTLDSYDETLDDYDQEKNPFSKHFKTDA